MPARKRSEAKKWILPLLGAAWLVLSLIAPFLPTAHLIHVLFGMAPPLLLVFPPAGLCLLFLVGAVRRKKAKFNLTWAAVFALGSMPLLGFRMPLAGPPQTTNRIKVMTMNVRQGSGEMPTVLGEILAENVDVVLLQENTDGDKSTGAYLMKNLKGWHYFADKETAILSRWPISSSVSIPLAKLPWRSLLEVEVEGPRRFRVMTEHWAVPQWRQGLPGIELGTDRQSAEYDQLVSEIEKTTLPLVMGGDLNNPDHHGLTRGLSSKMENCFAARGTGVGWTFPSKHPIVRIDHLYVKNGLRTVSCKVGPQLGSDHLPLIAEIGFAQ